VSARPKTPPAAAPATADLFGSPATVAAGAVQPAALDAHLHTLAARLDAAFSRRLHFGTSSWYFPGWAGLVWAREHSESILAKRGLPAYAQHPLLRTVSLDRSFYRPLPAATYAALAAQVPAGFKFVVKAASLVTDATVREPGSGKPAQPNPLFLDPAAAVQSCVEPAVQGLGAALGVLVFQLSPLPWHWLDDLDALYARLDALLAAVMPLVPAGAFVAVEPRDPQLVSPALARLLKAHGALYCLALHSRMPPIEEQLPMLRALWPGPLVCRWNLQRGLRYEQAKHLFEPFDKLAAPDAATRGVLARVVAATAAAGQPVFVTINNKAEGSAPLSVLELARAVAQQLD
jgi:uncharacterized protein YecE (DUF72 family)